MQTQRSAFGEVFRDFARRKTFFRLGDDLSLLFRRVHERLAHGSVVLVDDHQVEREHAVARQREVFLRIDAVAVEPLRDGAGSRHIRENPHDVVLRKGVSGHVGDLHVAAAELDQVAVQLFVAVDVAFLFALRDLVQRGLGEVDVPGLDERAELTEEEREEQRGDVGTVDVGICHEHDLVVAELLQMAFVVAHAASDGRDQRLDFLVLENAVRASLLHVQQLAADRDDRLVLAVAAALGGTAC